MTVLRTVYEVWILCPFVWAKTNYLCSFICHMKAISLCTMSLCNVVPASWDPMIVWCCLLFEYRYQVSYFIEQF